MATFARRARAPQVASGDSAHWSTRGACSIPGVDPDWWFTAHDLAAHICWSHCDVFAECSEQQPASPGGVVAGVAYTDANPKPATHQPVPRSRMGGCPWCPGPTRSPVDVLGPPTRDIVHCGTPRGRRAHYGRRERPCDDCVAAARSATRIEVTG